MKNKLSEEDKHLFREAVKGVKPLKPSNKVQAPANQPKPLRRKIAIAVDNTSCKDELSDHLTETVTGEQKLFYARPGLPLKRLRDLRQGKIKQGAILDLHGYTVSEARAALVRALDACARQHIRCLRIIHGKGRLQAHDQPILKNQINNWLRQRPDVLAFASATTPDGGAGAVYVLLKKAP